ncbi:protein of unknown function [Pararobbsia alpina]
MRSAPFEGLDYSDGSLPGEPMILAIQIRKNVIDGDRLPGRHGAAAFRR